MSRYLHTMLRVGDLQRSVDFYQQGIRHEGTAPARRARTANTPCRLSGSAMRTAAR